MRDSERVAAFGALLFASGEPVERARVAAVLGVTVDELETLVPELRRRAEALGLTLVVDGEMLQLVTAPRFGSLVAQLLGVGTSKLSPAALETLAIVAYLQPVTRAEVEAIRGVDSSTALQTLIAHGLIEPVGRRAGPGQAVEYGTTAAFCERFGLSALDELPPLPEEIQELLTTRRAGG